MTKGVCLLGSPRVGGNSDQLAGAFCRAAEEKGAEIQSFALRDLAFRGCIGLRHCKTGGEMCGLEDDLRFCRKVFAGLKSGLPWTQLCCEGRELLECRDACLG